MPLVASPPMKSASSSSSGKSQQPSNKVPIPPRVGAPSLITFFVLFTAHACAAAYAPIQDCDEVFNFWEPTHYLNHGFGLQTWELSPVYAIRSWLYVSLHSVIIKLVSLILPAVGSGSKTAQFFALRAVLSAISAACETRLFNRLARCMNPRIAVFYLVVTATSAGSFIASTSYLPSSFGMYMMTLALAEFVDWRSGLRTAHGLMWLAIGTIVGWPFIAVLCLPFVLEDVATSLLTGQVFDCVWRMGDGLARSLAVLAIEVAVDSFFFRKLTIVPLNIVLYNVFAGPTKGPNIYGTEPWHFYIWNLLLNFNFWLALALLATPLLFIYQLVRGRGSTRLGWVRSMVMASPLYLWLGIMTAQPHKEERFMYPVYPCIALNAAISMHILALTLGNSDRKTIIGAIPARLKFGAFSSIVLGGVALGIWRSAGLATAYGAPLTIYDGVQNKVDVARRTDDNTTLNVCVGKEWYRFPSSFHLPQDPLKYRLKFIKSAFSGLLPGEFAEDSKSGSDFFPGAHLEPPGMNDENVEDPAKYTSIQTCDLLVDSRFSGSFGGSDLEPDFIGMALKGENEWEILKCERFLDVAQSGALGRMGWVPDFVSARNDVPRLLRRQWGQYCLLARKAAGTENNAEELM